MFLCETWIGKNETCNLEIPGYQSEHIFGTKSKNTKRGRYSGGIAVYFRNDLKNFVKVIEKSSQGFLWHLPRYYCRWPTLNKFNQLMGKQSKHTLQHLSHYLYFAFLKRDGN